MSIDGKQIFEKAQNFLLNFLGKPIQQCSSEQIHNAIAKIIVQELCTNSWQKSKKAHSKVKNVFYLSAEFLVGRAIQNNLVCLGIFNEIKTLLKEKNFSIEHFEEIEDAALGNGGLGRLAACFLDSAATLKVPLNGYGIRYKFGYFKQIIENGFQVEYADDWTRFGDPWSIKNESESINVNFKNETVVAVPYDMPIIGYENSHVCTLRLWEAHSLNNFNFKLFNKGDYCGAFKEKNESESISSVIYPNDETKQGKLLRLKQQYFLCSASLQDVILKYKKNFNDEFANFSSLNMFQINDTHPAIAIAELVRLLCENEKIKFEKAFEIANQSFAYTNHTIMVEALEKWPISLMNEIIPNVVVYLELIQKHFEKEMSKHKISNEVFFNISPIQNGVVNMANLAIYGTKITNGVAKIHTEILKNSVFKNWFSIYPDRFQNKTNGITQRRWLLVCNENLSNFITKLLGSKKWVTNLNELKNLEKFENDEKVLEELNEIKFKNHEKLAHYLKISQNIEINPNTVFDVQIKRLHEYKRQLLNVLAILHFYFEIENGNLPDFEPTTFIFAAKAAPSYKRAKAIIKLINSVANLIKINSKVNKKINVVFVANYNVSYAEKIVAAADVSEQISTAGTEASGTSNMKFMLNGAVTLGTYDGANVEIVEQAGDESNYIFGNTVEQLNKLKNSHNPKKIYESNSKIKRVLDALDSGLLNDENTGCFKDLKNSILEGDKWHKPDQFFLLADFENYVKTKIQVLHDFKNRLSFAKKCLHNIANAGKFSADRTIKEYCKDIWKIEPIKF